ncbi:hypothetical protein OAG73_00255 [bacterium]|nr:hypothetical protein [bacterium]
MRLTKFKGDPAIPGCWVDYHLQEAADVDQARLDVERLGYHLACVRVAEQD